MAKYTSMCFLSVDKTWPKGEEHPFSIRAVAPQQIYVVKYTGQGIKKNALIRIE